MTTPRALAEKISIQPWDDGEVVICFNGKPIGQTLSKADASRIVGWLNTGVTELESLLSEALAEELQKQVSVITEERYKATRAAAYEEGVKAENARFFKQMQDEVIPAQRAICYEECAKMVQACDCEITLDQDGLDHILDEIVGKIRLRAGKL